MQIVSKAGFELQELPTLLYFCGLFGACAVAEEADGPANTVSNSTFFMPSVDCTSILGGNHASMSIYAFMNSSNNCTSNSLCKQKRIVPEVYNWRACAVLSFSVVPLTLQAPVLYLNEEAPNKLQAVACMGGEEAQGTCRSHDNNQWFHIRQRH